MGVSSTLAPSLVVRCLLACCGWEQEELVVSRKRCRGRRYTGVGAKRSVGLGATAWAWGLSVSVSVLPRASGGRVYKRHTCFYALTHSHH
jgi:hypothetical protein